MPNGLEKWLPPAMTGVGFLGAWLQAEKIRRRRVKFFEEEPPGVIGPETESFWPTRLMEDVPEHMQPDLSRIIYETAADYPEGALQIAGLEAGAERRVAQREGFAQAGEELGAPHEELLGRLEERLESPAISQREVNTMISQMRSQALGAGEQRMAAFEGSQPAGALAPGSADALRAILSGQTGQTMATGQMQTELEAAKLNRMFESQYMHDLMGGTQAYTTTMAPFLARGAELAGPGTGMEDLANYRLAMELMDMGYMDEANTLLMGLSSNVGQFGGEMTLSMMLARQREEAMEAAQPSGIGQYLNPLTYLGGTALGGLFGGGGGGTPTGQAPSYVPYMSLGGM